MSLKMFVWEDVLRDYTSGMVCVMANNIEEAFEMIYLKDDAAWSQLMGVWDRYSWDSDEMKELQKDYKELNLCQLQKKYFEIHNIKVFDWYIKPKIVQSPEAFIVRGGG